MSVIRGTQLARLLGDWRATIDVDASRGAAGRGFGYARGGDPGRAPEYRALAAAVRGLLTDGRLALGVRLPAERELAQSLSTSRTTVSGAYRVLREAGYLTSRRGAGSWTALPSGHRVQLAGLQPGAVPGGMDLACAALEAPPELMAAVQEAAGQLPWHAAGAGYEPMGVADLRERVAQGYRERGLPTDPSQILVTGGVQHAFGLLLRLFVEPGYRVVVETPTYPNALRALGLARARVLTYGLGPAGWDGEMLLATLRQARARMAYLVADYHNPTGHLMDAQLREALAATAQASGTDLVIDETFVDLRLSGPEVPPPVAAFDRAARVISIGSMSKPYWGGLRIGWIRAAAPVIARLADARLAVDIASPILDQLVAARLLERREHLVTARREQLSQRREALVDALTRYLPQWRFQVPGGGVSLWVELDAPVASALARTAQHLGVRVAAGPRFGIDGTLERFVRLPYTLPPADLTEAVRRLGRAYQGLEVESAPGYARPAVVA